MTHRIDRVSLKPERDVDDRNGRKIALGSEPWLGLDVGSVDSFAGRFVEIAYRLSFWDEPTRPVFRFWQGKAFVDRIAAGPILGAATWVGRVPAGTDRISVSPTHLCGRFDFAIEHIRVRRWPALIADGLRWHPRPTRSAILTKLIGWGPESDVNLAWATGSIPLSDYDQWRASRERALDLAGLDRPRCDWAVAPMIRIVILESTDHGALDRTIASLQAQAFPAWEAVVIGTYNVVDPRITVLALEAAAQSLTDDADGVLTGVLAAGDLLHPASLAIVAERAERAAASIFYGDEEQRRGDGTLYPCLKPGWSPRLQTRRPYLGRGIFIRDLKTWDLEARRSLFLFGDIPQATLVSFGPERIKPLHRILVETTEPPPPTFELVEPASASVCAAIIIPTRNHPALLRRILESIRATSRPGSFELLVIDNESNEPDATAYLDELRAATDLRVLDHPGPFNFSLICNEGVAQTTAEVVVFLNDDMEVLSEGWLDRLIAHAMEPDVGAVGARLTYPDGRLQHIGVLVGMGESAGHFGAPAPGDDQGWAGRNNVAHEVSAVTGACLAVARQKFEAVGGFDAEHLPIELSDIDLCLKLNARGWQTIVDPAVHLMHEESASRGGATLRRLTVHDRERAIFVERWRHVLRDDPYFHPGLSLYRWQAALG